MTTLAKQLQNACCNGAVQDMGVEAFRCNLGNQPNGHCNGAADQSQVQQPSHDTAQQLNGSLRTVSPSHPKPSPSNHEASKQQSTESQKVDSEPAFALPAHAVSYVANVAEPDSIDRLATTHISNDMTFQGADNELVASTSGAESHCGAVLSLALCGDYVCSSGSDAMIKVWKAGSLEFVR